MIPYIQAPRMTAAVLIAAAILTGHFLLIRRARHEGLDTGVAAGFSASMLGGGLLFGHWAKLLYLPDPWETIQGYPAILLRIFSGQASFGGLLGALLGGFVYLAWRKTDLRTALRWFDLIGFVFPFAWIFGRAQCVVVHDHPGIRTTSWLGVRYPDAVRFDLAVLEIVFLLAMIAAWLLLDRRRLLDGLHCGAFLIAYGLFRSQIDRLHVEVVRYLGWSVDQWASAGALLAGAGFLALAARRAIRATVPATPGGIPEVTS